jgi:hypothetical protein
VYVVEGRSSMALRSILSLQLIILYNMPRQGTRLSVVVLTVANGREDTMQCTLGRAYQNTGI